jgi:hypothetical protein
VEAGVDVDQHGDRAGEHDRLGGGEERVGRHDDFVTGPDPERPQGQLKGIGAVGHPDAVGTLAEAGEVGLEGGDCIAEHEIAPFEDVGHGREQLGGQRSVLRAEVHQWRSAW